MSQVQVISYHCDDCGRQVRDGASVCLRCAVVRVTEECGGDCECLLQGYVGRQCASRAGKLAGDRRVQDASIEASEPDDGRL